MAVAVDGLAIVGAVVGATVDATVSVAAGGWVSVGRAGADVAGTAGGAGGAGRSELGPPQATVSSAAARTSTRSAAKEEKERITMIS